VQQGLAVGAADRHLVLGPELAKLGTRGLQPGDESGDRGVDLTADDLAEIEKAVPAGAARGGRYPPAFMPSLGVRN
jgi:hypothetical protein